MGLITKQSEFNQIKDRQELVDVFLKDQSDMIIAYVLDSNDDFLTLAPITSTYSFGGAMMCRWVDIDSICAQTAINRQLTARIKDKAIFQQAQDKIKKLDSFSFEGLAKTLEGSQDLIRVAIASDVTIDGRIAGFDDQLMMLDEYALGRDVRTARTYININSITRMVVGMPMLDLVGEYLAGHKL